MLPIAVAYAFSRVSFSITRSLFLAYAVVFRVVWDNKILFSTP